MVGVFLDGTGWSHAACDYALALDAADVDVVCRPLKLNDASCEPPARVRELMRKSASGCTAVIQHVLPGQMEYCGRLGRNVGMFASETSDFCASGWADRLNQMDEVWVFNAQQVDACKRSGVQKPVRVVPHACDVTRYQRSYRTLESLRPCKENDEFLFYFVGEFVRRKNFAALLKAFHAEFDGNEHVRLALKTSIPGLSAQEARKKVMEFCAEIRRGAKLRGGPGAYREEIVLTERLSAEGMMRLHASCDCFVAACYGEAWCIPAFDAMAMGRTPIVPDWGGFREYVSNETGWLAPTYDEPVFGALDAPDGLFTGNETWAAIDVGRLRTFMREAYEDGKKREEKAARGVARAYDFSHEVVGARMRGLLATEPKEASHDLREVAGP